MSVVLKQIAKSVTITLSNKNFKTFPVSRPRPHHLETKTETETQNGLKPRPKPRPKPESKLYPWIAREQSIRYHIGNYLKPYENKFAQRFLPTGSTQNKLCGLIEIH